MADATRTGPGPVLTLQRLKNRARAQETAVTTALHLTPRVRPGPSRSLARTYRCRAAALTLAARQHPLGVRDRLRLTVSLSMGSAWG